MEKNENIIRTVLKNEVTWLVFLGAGFWTIVQTVVLPIQEMQIVLAQVQKDIVEIKLTAKDTENQIITNTANIGKLDVRVSALEKNQ
jgi:hypothetical protein